MTLGAAMPERLAMQLDNRFVVPPEYALAWLTDFRADDMQAVGGKSAPSIVVRRLPDGRLQREFSMMGLSFVTRTTIESPTRWVALAEARSKKGVLQSITRIVETVEDERGGTRHHVDLFQDDRTMLSKMMFTLSLPMQKAQLRKLFAHQKREMEAAYKAGKPATA